jgi:hypothetical protein
VRNATPMFDMLKITEMNFHRKGGAMETHGASDSDEESSTFSTDLAPGEMIGARKARATISPTRTSIRMNGSPTHEGINPGIISITGTRTSMFLAGDRRDPMVRRSKSPPSASQNYLSARNLPQSNLFYGKGSHNRTTPRSALTTPPLDVPSNSSPTPALTMDLHEWLQSVMHSPSKKSIGSPSIAIDLASETRTLGPSSSSLGAGLSLASLGSVDVHLNALSPHPPTVAQAMLFNDDLDCEEVEPAPQSNETKPQGAASLQQVSATDPIAGPAYSANLPSGGLGYGLSASSWDPKRTNPIRSRKPDEKRKRDRKLQISKEVAKSRAKYKIPDYVPEATRGRNPLIPPELRMRGKDGEEEDEGVDIIELLSDSLSQVMNPGKTIPLSSTQRPEPRSGPSSNSTGSLRTGLSLVNVTTKGSQTQLTHTPPSLLLPSHNKLEAPSSLFLTESVENKEFVLTKPKTSTAAALEHKYRIDAQARTLEQRSPPLVMTDSLAPELFVTSRHHPSTSQFGTLPSLSASSAMSIGRQITQPHAADPFASYGPWIPQGGMGVMLSDKSDRVLSWEEKRDILRFCPCDSTEVRTVLKRQNVVRHSFEGYSKQGAVGGGAGRDRSLAALTADRPTDRLTDLI